ncbi:HNH endonuclease [Halorhodospira abdelmalekii]|uniref:HNH endonuclease n=1 Tax=Halorhodospira abdelmalekii TaxID=421629 RepID=UPI0019078D7C|nr:HNH endonuclease [Halorhodospira abdelmalekii]MBK1734430.1 HNH endonuclease [Halorhodospira abdelmalekii]
MPLEWVGYEEAVRYYYLEQVAYACGSTLYQIRGGYNSVTGQRSVLTLNSIIATEGARQALLKGRIGYVPPLSNPTLFRRDANVCLYCGKRFRNAELSRDHVTPVSRGGFDTWNNVVTACKRCNNHKGDRSPEQAGMQLIAVPFTPTHAEYVYLQGRRILADQMEFLKSHFPRRSPLRVRLP